MHIGRIEFDPIPGRSREVSHVWVPILLLALLLVALAAVMTVPAGPVAMGGCVG